MRKIVTLLIVTFILSGQLLAQFPIGNQTFSFAGGVTGDVYYPAVSAGNNATVANGQFPIVVIGHGFSIATTEYDFLYNSLAEDGYIVAVPDTEGGVFPFPNHGNFASDIATLVTQYYLEGDDPSSAFYQKVIKRSCIIGHSMGGGCVFLAAQNNPEITTMISMAAAETNPSSTTAAANVTIPTLTMAGSADCVADPAGNQIPMYNALASNYKAYMEITDASHCQFGKASSGSICTFGESCSGFISKADQHSYMAQAYEPWLDFYLRGNCAAWTDFRTYLTTATTHTYQESGAVLAPNATLNADMTSICDGDVANISSDLTLTLSGTGVVCDYQWQRNGNNISGATTDTYTTAMAGDYTLVVTNYNGVMTTSSNTVIITVNTSPSPVISANGATTLCNGGSVDLQSSSADSYQWYLNGNMIGGATNQSYIATTAGDYTVEVTTNNCTGTSNPTSITSSSASTPNVTANGTTNFCNGGSVDLQSSSADSYQWYLNGNMIGGATNQSYSATTNGNYTVEVTINNCIATSNPTTVTSSTFNASITANGATSFCNGDSVILQSSSADSYQWYLDENPIGGAMGQFYTTMTSGDYTIEATINGCSSVSNQIVTMVYSIPTVTSIGDSLISSTGATYQWYQDGNLIDGAIDQSYCPGSTANYTVEVTDNNGCTSESMPSNVVISGIYTMTIEGLAIFPNPTQNFIEISYTDSKVFTVNILDITGKLVANSIIDKQATIDMTQLESGVYFIRMNNKDGIYTEKIIKY